MICVRMITKIKLLIIKNKKLRLKKYLLPSDGSPALLLVQQGKYELTSHILPWLNVSAWKISCILV